MLLCRHQVGISDREIRRVIYIIDIVQVPKARHSHLRVECHTKAVLSARRYIQRSIVEVVVEASSHRCILRSPQIGGREFGIAIAQVQREPLLTLAAYPN